MEILFPSYLADRGASRGRRNLEGHAALRNFLYSRGIRLRDVLKGFAFCARWGSGQAIQGVRGVGSHGILGGREQAPWEW